jgi:threonine dehydrogenase-like Zn-dependent dehydrogenase
MTFRAVRKRMRRRFVEIIRSGRVDTRPLVIHRFKLDDIEQACELFAST